MGLLKPPALEDYRDKYATFFKMERSDGVLEVTMHTEGGPGRLLHGAAQCVDPSLAGTSEMIPRTRCSIFSGTGNSRPDRYA